MKAMKWLRSCGVRNINVFIDGHYYSELMQQATGEEMQLTAGYSLYPVFQKSIFHPKIWMLFGDKEGLLIVGSGNLTNSGNGNNDDAEEDQEKVNGYCSIIFEADMVAFNSCAQIVDQSVSYSLYE
jgi:hypothetical protein